MQHTRNDRKNASFVVIIFLLVFSFSSKYSNAQNLTQGLLGYYPFNGNANDASGNGFNGVLNNGATFTADRFGNPNGALLLDGIDDFVEIFHNGSLGSRSAFSFAMYFYSTDASYVQTLLDRRNRATQTQAQFQAFINWNQEPGFGYGQHYSNNAACNTVVNQYNVYVNTGVGTVVVNQWHCVVGTFDGVNQKIYLDGVLKESLPTPLNKMDSCANTPLVVGRHTDIDRQSFKGKIDELRLYNRALSQQDITALCSFNSFTSCSGYQMSLGTTANFERGYDIAATQNNEYFIAGVHRPAGNDDILITKITQSGSVLWSKSFGGTSAESVRKIAPTSDGGLLVVGQTKSFSNAIGEILCFKVDGSGNLVWSRKFNQSSPSGELGMDIVETPVDGGCAVSGILNVNGGVADAVVIKLNSTAGVMWAKRLDRGDGEDGVGLVSKGDTLVAAIDLQHSGGNYTISLTKLKMSDGSFIAAKELSPAARGLFNPYLTRNPNPAQPGYIISGHTIDGTSYANMKHTIITVNENLDIVSTRLISFPTVTNDFFTGILPLNDGSIIGCASPQGGADGYFYKIGSNGLVSFSKRINETLDRRLYRLAGNGNEVMAVGGAVVNGQEDVFVTNFNTDGALGATCNVENVTMTIEIPAYSASSFSWPTISNVTFNNTTVALTSATPAFVRKDYCARAPFDFAYQQNLCAPKTVQFTSSAGGLGTLQWTFGDGQINTTSGSPVNTYANAGIYQVNLSVVNSAGCVDSVSKPVNINLVFDPTLITQVDTTICAGDSVLLSSTMQLGNYCITPSPAQPSVGINTYVKPTINTTYTLTSQVLGANLIVNPNFSAGNTGFTSDYTYTPNNTTEGQYFVGSNPSLWNPGMSPCTDHTTGSGQMMFLNGSPTLNSKIWTQTITVQPNTNYNFSSWITAFFPQNPPVLQFSINNVNLGNTITATPTTCQWTQFSSVWNSGTNTTATISIVNNNTAAGGNDFGIDDLFFGTVSIKYDTLNVSIGSLCTSIDLAGPSTVCDTSGTFNFTVTKGANCTQAYVIDVDPAKATVSSVLPGSFKVKFLQNGITRLITKISSSCSTVADTSFVDVKVSPALNIGPDLSMCRDSSFLLTAQTGYASYLWHNGSTAQTFQVSNGGLYFVTATDFCGVAKTDSFRFVRTVPAPFGFSPPSASVCKGDSVSFTGSGGNSYSWQPANLFANPASANTKAIVSANQNYTLHIVDGACQRDTLITIPVQASAGPVISVSKKNDVSCTTDTAMIVASGATSYTWVSDNTIIRNDNAGNITVRPIQTTTYYVKGRNGLGCETLDSVTINFNRTGTQKLYIPNAFTPNGDLKNDLFNIKLPGAYPSFDLKIFNRWGELVFISADPSKGWDGRYKGELQPQGVFVYYLKAEGLCGGKFEEKGTFVLIR